MGSLVGVGRRSTPTATCYQSLQKHSDSPKTHRGLWSWSPADQTPSRPSVTCAAVPAGSSSGAAPGARPHQTSAPGATGPALRLCSLSSSARRRPARLPRLLCRPLLRAVAVAVAGLDLPPPESPLRPESHNTRTVRARLRARSPAPAQATASGCACVVVRVPAGAAPVGTQDHGWLSQSSLLIGTRVMSQTLSQLLTPGVREKTCTFRPEQTELDRLRN